MVQGIREIYVMNPIGEIPENCHHRTKPRGHKFEIRLNIELSCRDKA